MEVRPSTIWKKGIKGGNARGIGDCRQRHVLRMEGLFFFSLAQGPRATLRRRMGGLEDVRGRWQTGGGDDLRRAGRRGACGSASGHDWRDMQLGRRWWQRSARLRPPWWLTSSCRNERHRPSETARRLARRKVGLPSSSYLMLPSIKLVFGVYAS